MASQPIVADEVRHLAFLVGSWTGEGDGVYPTIEPFHYQEIATFDDIGRPFLMYSQSTKNLTTGLAAHTESGYVRPAPGGGMQLVVAHAFGVAEVSEGMVDGTTVTLRSTGLSRTSTAKQVDAVERTITVDGDVLRYTVRMAAVGQPLQDHLKAELRRVEIPA
jgi:hypothetical protein